MGNRAVITTKDVNKQNQNQKLGIYLHWCGSKKDIKKILTECKKRDIKTPDSDYQYFFARFCQAAAEYCGKEANTGIGIDIVANLDTHNGDNGVYYINNNFDIVRQTDGSELEKGDKKHDNNILQF